MTRLQLKLIFGWLEARVARANTAIRQNGFGRVRAECEFTGGYTIVKDYVRSSKRGGKEMFVPLSHPPGHVPPILAKLWL